MGCAGTHGQIRQLRPHPRRTALTRGIQAGATLTRWAISASSLQWLWHPQTVSKYKLSFPQLTVRFGHRTYWKSRKLNRTSRWKLIPKENQQHKILIWYRAAISYLYKKNMSMKKYDWSKDRVRKAAEKANCWFECLEMLGIPKQGYNYRTLQNKVREYNIDVTHF